VPEAEPDFLELLRALSRHEVRFLLIGGVSAVLQGAPISTFDLDVLHLRTEENVARLIAALGEVDAHYREHRDRRPVPEARHLAGPGHHLLMTRFGPLDLLGELTGGRVFEDLEPKATMMELERDLRVYVLDLETLIALKEEMRREKDIAVLPVLRRTLREKGGGEGPSGSA
jgi:hypothetical protein